jgi:hypothetical protein
MLSRLKARGREIAPSARGFSVPTIAGLVNHGLATLAREPTAAANRTA